MNKTDQQKNNIYINYWTEMGLSAKKDNQSAKIEKTYIYTDSKGIQRSRTTKKHPSLKDVSFENKSPVILTIGDSKEEYRKFIIKEKEQKNERLNKLSFSSYHNKLVNNSYGKINNTIKQQSLIAAHNAKIEKLIFEKKQRQLFCKNQSKKDCPNLVIINMLDSKGLPYCFSSTPSRLSLDELFKIAKSTNVQMSKYPKYFSTEIWEKSEYIRRMSTGIGTYRYNIYRETALENAA